MLNDKIYAMKIIITPLILLMINTTLFSQVGIQTVHPQATLDVVGEPVNPLAMDGVIAPRLTGAQLRAKQYTSSQTGALVYVTLADTNPQNQTEDVTAEGYYYFDGIKWINTAGSGVNIYNADGALTDYRKVDLNGNSLTFQGSGGYFDFESDGRHLTIHGTEDRAHLRFSTDDIDQDGISSYFDMDLFADNYFQMFGTGKMDGISFGTHYTQNTSPIDFVTSPGEFTSGETRMRITGEGNVGISETSPTEKVDIGEGNLRIREINFNAGTTTDRVVVTDTDGVLKTLPASNLSVSNLFNSNGSLTGAGSSRDVTLNGKTLNFTGTAQRMVVDASGSLALSNVLPTSGQASVALYGGNSSNLFIQQFYNSNAQILTDGNSTNLTIGTHFTNAPAPLRFITSSGSTSGAERMRITGAGNVGINTANPSEKFQVDGNVRFNNLPMSGASNVIHTQSNGSISTNQDQTFTATRTIVSNSNGVLGYVNHSPMEVMLSANVPGTQNIRNTTTPVTGIFSTENADPYEAWSSNVFTVPAEKSGMFILTMQNSSLHTPQTGQWHTIAYFERSTNGGTSWNALIKDTSANNLGTDVDNGNSLHWTGFLDAGDSIRVRFNCSATSNNIVNLGSITIIRL